MPLIFYVVFDLHQMIFNNQIGNNLFVCIIINNTREVDTRIITKRELSIPYRQCISTDFISIYK